MLWEIILMHNDEFRDVQRLAEKDDLRYSMFLSELQSPKQ